MKKVILIHHSGRIGGAGVSAYNTVTTLSKKYNVIVYCPSYPKGYSEYLKSKGINVRTFDFKIGMISYFSGSLPIFSPPFIKDLISIFSSRTKLEELLSAEKPDVIILNSKTTAWISLIAKRIGARSICFVRETRKGSLLNFWNSIQKIFLEKCSEVIFISKYDKQKENLKRTKTQVIPNYLKLDDYEKKKDCNAISDKLEISRKSFNILFVGGMLRIKGFDVAVKSLKYLKDYDVSLVVAGNSDFKYSESRRLDIKIYNKIKKRYENIIQKEIEINKLSNIIHKVGVYEDMRDLYTIADVLIFPANEPHQARPVFEAGAQKLPVIMPDFENTSEYVQNGVNGLIFNKRDPSSLAEAIEKLIIDPEYRSKLGNTNYSFTVKNHVSEHAEVLIERAISNFFS